MTTSQKKNIRYIDILKALAMVLVVLSHITFANQDIKGWIRAFTIPVFFFSSGLLLKAEAGGTVKEELLFLRKKFIGIMVPYFMWAIVYAAVSIHTLIRILYGSFEMIRSSGSPNYLSTQLWFLPVLFCTMVMFSACRLVFRGKLTLPVKLILAALFLAVGNLPPKLRIGYPWGINIALNSFGFIMLGNALLPTLQRIRAGMNSGRGLAFAVLALCLCFAGTLLYGLNVQAGDGIGVHIAQFGNYPLYLLSACVGTAFLIVLSMVLDRLLPEGQTGLAGFLVFFGKNTMCTLAIHMFIIKQAFKPLFAAVHVPSAVVLIVSCVGTIALCSLVTPFINAYLPTMAGRAPDKKPEKKK